MSSALLLLLPPPFCLRRSQEAAALESPLLDLQFQLARRSARSSPSAAVASPSSSSCRLSVPFLVAVVVVVASISV